MSKVGFIGLGTMGGPMAKNLLAAGHEMIFFARRDEVIQQFESAGAAAVQSPAAVAQRSDFIVTMVTDDDAVRRVALGTDGIIAEAGPGKLLIEMSTIGRATVRDVGSALAERDMAMLDAPVSGGPSGAESGKLSIMVGGDAGDFARAGPVLEVLGQNIVHVGPLGAGQTVKLANQLIGGGIMVLLGEAMALVKAAGVDLEKFVDVVDTSSGNSAVFQSRGRKFVLADRYPPAFSTSLMRKDVALALELAGELNVPLPLTGATLQQYDAALSHGFGPQDFASVAKVCAEAAGLKLVT